MVVTAAVRRTAASYQLEGPAVCVPLISSTGHGDAALHRVHYQEGKFALANLLVALKPIDPKICDPKYLYHLLTAKKDQYFVPLMLGTANVSLKEKDIANVEIPLPPISHQVRIVRRIEEIAAQIEELQKLRRLALTEAAALFVVESRRIFKLGVAGDWPFHTVEACCEEIIDYRGRTPPVAESGIPHLTSANIKNGRINWSTTKFVSEETYTAYMTRGLPRPGDVIFTMEAPLGEAAVIPGERKFSLAQRTLLLRPKEFIDPEYLVAAITSPDVREAIYAQATGTTVKGIASKRLKHIQLPVPTASEQRRVVVYLNEFRNKVDALQLLQGDFSKQLDLFMPSVLDKAFRGEL